LEKQFKDSP